MKAISLLLALILIIAGVCTVIYTLDATTEVLNETYEILNDAAKQFLDRGGKISDLQTRSLDLSNEALKFSKTTDSLNNSNYFGNFAFLEPFSSFAWGGLGFYI